MEIWAQVTCEHSPFLNFTTNYPNMVPYYQHILANYPDIRILFYSGDVDIGIALPYKSLPLDLTISRLLSLSLYIYIYIYIYQSIYLSSLQPPCHSRVCKCVWWTLDLLSSGRGVTGQLMEELLVCCWRRTRSDGRMIGTWKMRTFSRM